MGSGPLTADALRRLDPSLVPAIAAELGYGEATVLAAFRALGDDRCLSALSHPGLRNLWHVRLLLACVRRAASSAANITTLQNNQSTAPRSGFNKNLPTPLQASALLLACGGDNGTVYFVGPDDRAACKIGFTTKGVRWRLRQLQAGNHVPLVVYRSISGGSNDERMLHFVMRGDRIHGEWFRFSERLSELLGAGDPIGLAREWTAAVSAGVDLRNLRNNRPSC